MVCNSPSQDGEEISCRRTTNDTSLGAASSYCVPPRVAMHEHMLEMFRAVKLCVDTIRALNDPRAFDCEVQEVSLIYDFV